MVWSPEKYEQATVLQRAVGQALLSRLALMAVTPRTIVDVCGGVAELGNGLQQRYPTAQVLVQSAEWEMITVAQQHYPHLSYLCNKKTSLSYVPRSFDIVCANWVLPWCSDLATLLTQWQSILRPHGLLIWSALGLDTLVEIRESLPHGLVPRLWDMHDLGDALINAGFVDPVVEVEQYQLKYRDQQKCVDELISSQMIHAADQSSCMQNLAHQREIVLSYEVIYGHAWLPAEISYKADAAGVTSIPLAALRQQLREKK